MHEDYYWIGLLLMVTLMMGILPLVANRILSVSHPSLAKCSPYECGFTTFGDARFSLNIRYYVVALLFLLFDVETAVLMPWAVACRSLGWHGFCYVLVFFGLLLFGFLIEWQKGGLDWQ
jgi:NADH-quinone oxidoreductase subunit A